jgi:MATE family multidrug resistance protein
VNSAIFLTFKDNWGYMFSDDSDLVREVSKILPLVALFQIVDGLGAVTGAILRAKAQQDVGAVLNLVGYYVIGIPFGLVLGFKVGLGLIGLWIGLMVALVFVAGIGLYCEPFLYLSL